MSNQCNSTHAPRGVMAFIATRGDKDQQVTLRCRLEAGHEGQHRASYSPFPGFADEFVTWADPT